MFAGDRLHDWAQARIIRTSTLALLGPSDPALLSAETADVDAVVAGDAEQAGGAQPDGAADAQPVVAVPAINVLLLGTDARSDEHGRSPHGYDDPADAGPAAPDRGHAVVAARPVAADSGSGVFEQDQHGLSAWRVRGLSRRRPATGEGHGEQLHRPAGAILCARQLPGVRGTGRPDRRRRGSSAADDPRRRVSHG